MNEQLFVNHVIFNFEIMCNSSKFIVRFYNTNVNEKIVIDWVRRPSSEFEESLKWCLALTRTRQPLQALIRFIYIWTIILSSLLFEIRKGEQFLLRKYRNDLKLYMSSNRMWSCSMIYLWMGATFIIMHLRQYFVNGRKCTDKID